MRSSNRKLPIDPYHESLSDITSSASKRRIIIGVDDGSNDENFEHGDIDRRSQSTPSTARSGTTSSSLSQRPPPTQFAGKRFKDNTINRSPVPTLSASKTPTPQKPTQTMSPETPTCEPQTRTCDFSLVGPDGKAGFLVPKRKKSQPHVRIQDDAETFDDNVPVHDPHDVINAIVERPRWPTRTDSRKARTASPWREPASRQSQTAEHASSPVVSRQHSNMTTETRIYNPEPMPDNPDFDGFSDSNEGPEPDFLTKLNVPPRSGLASGLSDRNVQRTAEPRAQPQENAEQKLDSNTRKPRALQSSQPNYYQTTASQGRTASPMRHLDHYSRSDSTGSLSQFSDFDMPAASRGTSMTTDVPRSKGLNQNQNQNQTQSWRESHIEDGASFSPEIFEENFSAERTLRNRSKHMSMGQSTIGTVSAGRDLRQKEEDAASELSAVVFPPDIGRHKGSVNGASPMAQLEKQTTEKSKEERIREAQNTLRELMCEKSSPARPSDVRPRPVRTETANSKKSGGLFSRFRGKTRMN